MQSLMIALSDLTERSKGYDRILFLSSLKILSSVGFANSVEGTRYRCHRLCIGYGRSCKSINARDNLSMVGIKQARRGEEYERICIHCRFQGVRILSDWPFWV